MVNYFQAIILGLVQGITELFPISSLGHSVILPALFGWNIDQSNASFLIFLVATHFATSLALLAFFYKDWIRIVKGFFRTGARTVFPYTKLAWLIVLGTIPAGLVGLIFQTKLQELFASPRLVALVLIVNGLMLWGVEKLHTNKVDRVAEKESDAGSDTRIAGLTWMQAIKVGLAQSLALIPGFSRTGATQGGSVLAGLSREDAIRFAFLLATPIIFAAAVLKLPQLVHLVHTGGMHILGPFLAGSIAAFLAAYFSARFLVRYFKTKTLMPFAIYCMAFGAFASVLFLIIK